MSKKFKENQRIKLVKDNEIVDGTIQSLYENVNLAVVRLEDNSCIKIHIDKLLTVESEVHSEEKQVEDVNLNITKDEFMRVSSVILSILGKMLFEESEND